ncbi:hypothetical protein [Bradyrhizobium sp. B117]|uniref:hypothetical protein n=1 Tax=Bradyrhizobium sp. B117 TaxID=3140246 RepID=UPI0031837ECA
MVDRLAGKDSAFRRSTGKAEALRAKLAREEIKAPTDVDGDVVFAGAVQALPTTVKSKDLERMRTILLDCLGAFALVSRNIFRASRSAGVGVLRSDVRLLIAPSFGRKRSLRYVCAFGPPT